MESCLLCEGFNILWQNNLGSQYVKEGDAEVVQWITQQTISMTLTSMKVVSYERRGSVVGSWLLDLTATVLPFSIRLSKFDGGVSDSGEGRWTVHVACGSRCSSPVITTALYSRFESRRLGRFANRVLNGMRVMFGGHDVRDVLKWISIPLCIIHNIFRGTKR